MKGLATLFVVLISASAFTSDYFNTYNVHAMPRRNIMDIMMQVESSLSAGHPLDTVTGMLNDFKDAVNQE